MAICGADEGNPKFNNSHDSACEWSPQADKEEECSESTRYQKYRQPKLPRRTVQFRPAGEKEETGNQEAQNEDALPGKTVSEIGIKALQGVPISSCKTRSPGASLE